jgi:hypothetical protein
VHGNTRGSLSSPVSDYIFRRPSSSSETKGKNLESSVIIKKHKSYSNQFNFATLGPALFLVLWHIEHGEHRPVLANHMHSGACGAGSSRVVENQS